MTCFAQWLDENDLDAAEFARMAGWPPLRAQRYAAGVRMPNREGFATIYRLTRGELTPNHFYGIHFYGTAPLPAAAPHSGAAAPATAGPAELPAVSSIDLAAGQPPAPAAPFHGEAA